MKAWWTKSIPKALKLLSYLCRLEYLGHGPDGTGSSSFARTPVFVIVSALWIVFSFKCLVFIPFDMRFTSFLTLLEGGLRTQL